MKVMLTLCWSVTWFRHDCWRAITNLPQRNTRNHEDGHAQTEKAGGHPFEVTFTAGVVRDDTESGVRHYVGAGQIANVGTLKAIADGDKY